MKPTIFTSDWHLPPARTAQTDFFARFVDEICTGAEQVIIVGDLFAAWVGPRHANAAGHAAALDSLAKLARAGTKVVVVAGNRDFLLDERTLAPYGIEYHSRAWKGVACGRNVLATHGDLIDRGDFIHHVFRGITGSFPLSTVAKMMPLCLSGLFAWMYRTASAARHKQIPSTNDRPRGPALREIFEGGTDVAVTGHWHYPEIVNDACGIQGKTLVKLGECTDTAASYATVSDTIELRSFAAG